MSSSEPVSDDGSLADLIDRSFDEIHEYLGRRYADPVTAPAIGGSESIFLFEDRTSSPRGTASVSLHYFAMSDNWYLNQQRASGVSMSWSWSMTEDRFCDRVSLSLFHRLSRHQLTHVAKLRMMTRK